MAAQPDRRRELQLDFDIDWSLLVTLRANREGPVLATEAVTDADLLEARSEAWFNGFLRAGRPDVPLESVTTRLAPVETAKGRGRCMGFQLQAACAEVPGTSVHAFGLSSLYPVAQRGCARLLSEGLLAAGDTFVYEIQPRRGPTRSPKPQAAEMRITTTAAPLRYRSLALEGLLARARGEGDAAGSFPVVFSASAHDKARRFARKGAVAAKPVETGALLIGRLCACPDTGEMFVTVHDAIEVADAAQTEFSLIPTSRTWGQVQTLLRRLGASDGGVRLVGQAHGHNFAVEGGPCDLCARTRECGKTTVFVSTADRAFMRTVFARQPFALCWIAGSNARGEEAARLFTLSAGVLAPRGYHIVDNLDS